MHKLALLFITLLLVGVSVSGYPANRDRFRFENEAIRVSLSPRTPEQIAAFYEGRKFPHAMIERLKNTCFITVGIKNKSSEVIWLELDNWSFKTATGEVKRFHRNEWPSQWQALSVPMASQSTFRWTLLPEKLDFRPGEREGGNIILEPSTQAFTVTAHFRKDKQPGPGIELTLHDVRCKK